jgi:hypothetical protein
MILYSLDTTQFPNGTYTLKVQIADDAGNTSIAEPGEISITISN